MDLVANLIRDIMNTWRKRTTENIMAQIDEDEDQYQIFSGFGLEEQAIVRLSNQLDAASGDWLKLKEELTSTKDILERKEDEIIALKTVIDDLMTPWYSKIKLPRISIKWKE